MAADAGAGAPVPLAMTAVAGGAVVEFVTGSGRGGSEELAAMFPAERRRRSMFEKPKPPVPLWFEGGVG